jgi:hypothetical protein
VGLKKLEKWFVIEVCKQLYHKMLPKVFAVYHASTETFQVLQTETQEDGTIVRLKNWARPNLKDWATTPVEKRTDLLRWSKSQEWYVCKTHKSLSDTKPPIYKDVIHDKTYHFWFLNHMLVWSDYGVYRKRHEETKDEWMKSPMIPVLEFATKQMYPRTNTGFYTFWSETTKDDVESVSEAGREEFRNSGQMDDSTNEHIDPRYLRIRTPSPRDEDSMSSDDCCHSESKKRGRGFSDMADSVDEQIEGHCGGQKFTQKVSIGTLLVFFSLWSVSVFMTMTY